MPGAATLLQQGWLFIPSAILLGALHGLEPGHSKTMMAAFIVAIRGSVRQAVLLGLAATLSHTAIVWLIALGGVAFISRAEPQTFEPYFRLAGAILILGIAVWMAAATHRRLHRIAHSHHEHDVDDDAHTLAHAVEIERRVTHGRATNGQIVAFGLTGGLIPCAGAITILLLCLQLQKVALGAVLVLSFSVGLAATLVLSGVVAAIGLRHARRRWSRFNELAARAPYLSSAITLAVGLYLGAAAVAALNG
jgi:nickel/cobalt exporter